MACASGHTGPSGGQSNTKSASKKSNRRKGAAGLADEKKGVFRPYHSVSVPKNVDLQTQFQGENRPKTTVMLRNIPNRYTQATLLQEIDDAGFDGAYDFFYLPMDTQNRTNVGYAFINFVTPEDLDKFTSMFVGYAFQDHASQKVARVSLAHIQGFIENIRHFSNRAVSQSRNNQYRPIVIHSGVRMDISEAYELLCCVQSSKTQPATTSQPQVGLQAWPEPRADFTSVKGPVPPGPTVSQPAKQKQSALPPGLLSLPSPPGLHKQQRQLSQSKLALQASTFSSLEVMLPSAAAKEDLGGAFNDAKKGFEAAISMLLLQSSHKAGEQALVNSSCAELQQAQSHADEPYDYNDETSTEGGSPPGTPRSHSEVVKEHFSLSLPQGASAADGCETATTPRTNRTLFVHGRFSA